MAQAKPACGSHPHGCNADVLSIQYNTIQSTETPDREWTGHACIIHYAFLNKLPVLESYVRPVFARWQTG